MSRTIDERVVSMQFDNKQFESNVATSMGTLEKLKQSLNFTGAAKGLEGINTATRRFDLSPLANAVDTVGIRFNALYTVADQALRNITNSAMAAGRNILSALTIQPVKMGLSEYETQIGAVQTILANTQSKGTNIDDVNAALDELNTYADKTIYNFTEMTRNIGTFTAAGVDLDKSVTSIKGIANLAAVSGSTSQQASTAMYQLSQALAAGKVQLMDWNSVVNAGMGGQVFQDALKRTATQMGYNVDEMIKKYGSFRESLTKGEWLTAEVLTETLTQLSGAYDKADLVAQGYTEAQAEEIVKLAETAVDAATKVKTFTQLVDTTKEALQSGWTQTWELLIGDFEEAKELWSNVSDELGAIINASSESRNELLAGALNNNWEKLIESINGAGVETKVFEEKVRAVSEKHGIDLDAMIAKHGSLEKAFRSGAISSDILKEAVDGLSASVTDLSGIEVDLQFGDTGEDVKKVQQLLKDLGHDIGETGVDGVIGSNTEAAIKAFQELNGLEVTGIIDEATIAALEKATSGAEGLSDAVGGLIDGITELGGREILIESFKNVFNGLKTVVFPIKKAFRDIFPPTTVEQLLNLINKFRDFTAGLKLNATQMANVYKVAKGFFSAIDIGITFVKEFASGALKLAGNLTGLADGALGVAGSFGEWVSGLRDSIKETDIFGQTIEKIVSFLQSMIDKVKTVGSSIMDKIEMPGFEGFLSVMEAIWNVIQKVGSKITSIGSSIGGALANAFGNGEIAAGLDVLNSGLLTGILLSFKKALGGFSDTFDGVIDILDSVKGCFEAWQTDLKANALLKIAAAIGILAVSILLIASINPGKLASSLGAITVLFTELMASMAIFSRISGNTLGLMKASTAMIAISAAVLLLSTALKNVSDLSWDEIAKGLVGVAGLMTIIVAAAKVLGSAKKTVIKGTLSMVIFAGAIKILASACRDMSSLSWEELAKGLVGVGALMAAISLFLNTAKLSGKAVLTATGIVILSAAMKILASACANFGQLSWEQIGKGLAAIGALLLEISVFTNLTGNAKHVVSTGLSLIMLGAAMKIFASAMKDLSGMSWTDIGKGLTGIAGALISVAVATRLMPKNMLGIGASLLIISGALVILTDVLAEMGGMTWESIAKGLITLGGSMLVLAAGLKFMTGSLSGAAALIVAAGAIAILTPALKSLGSLSIGEIIKGLLTLAGAFAVIGLAGYLLGPVVPAIIGLAGAFALIGLSVAAVGIGLAAVAAGFTALAVAGSAGAAAIVASLSVIITGIAELIPAVAQKLGEAVIVFCKVIAESVPELGKAIKAVVLTLIDVLVECVPEIVDGLSILLVEIISSLATYAPQIVDSLFDFIISLLDGLSARIPELIQAGVNLFMSFFSGVVDALSGINPDTFIKALLGVGIIAGVIGAISLISPLIPGAIAGVLGMGVVIAELAIVLAAIGALAQIPGLQWLIGEGASFMQQIGSAIGGFVGSIIGGIAEGITSSLPQIATDLSNFMTNLQPFIDGAKQLDATMLTGVSTLVDVITELTKASVLEAITSWITGGSTLTDFANQLVPFGTAMKNFSVEIAGLDDNAIVAAANAGTILAEMASTIPNTGGLVSWFTGDNSMETFGTQLVAFGTAMKNFSTEVSGIDETAVTAAANAGSMMAEMATTIPNTGGLVSWFTGDNNMETFGTQLVAFGTAMKNFSNEVTGIDEGAVTAASTAGKALTEMANNLPESGGIWSWFTADNDMSTFASQLKKFGEGMKDFSTEVSGIDRAAITTATTASTDIIDMANNMPSAETLNTLGTFADKAKKFATGIKKMAGELSGIDSTKLSTSIQNVKELLNIAKTLGDTNVDGLSTFGESLSKIGKSGVDSFVKAFTDSSDKVSKAGSDMLANLIKGVTSKQSTVVKTFTTMTSSIVTSLKNGYSKFYDAGKYLVQGFADGISINTFRATAKAKAMADAAYEAARKALNVNSPSKRFRSLGTTVPEGFAMGIDKLGRLVKSSAVGMADTAIDGTKRALTRIAQAVNTDIDSQPTIRPVLDLSDIRSNAVAINDMLNTNPHIGALSKVGTINTMMNQSQNGVTNSDVVAAINNLSRKLGKLNSNTYNINGISYDDGSNITEAVRIITRAAIVERRR